MSFWCRCLSRRRGDLQRQALFQEQFERIQSVYPGTGYVCLLDGDTGAMMCVTLFNCCSFLYCSIAIYCIVLSIWEDCRLNGYFYVFLVLCLFCVAIKCTIRDDGSEHGRVYTHHYEPQGRCAAVWCVLLPLLELELVCCDFLLF